MNTKSIPAVFTSKLVSEGDFNYSNNFDTIYIILPGAKHPDALSIQKGNQGGDRVWGWNGNVQSPTLTPSISSPNEWHGYLIDGQLKSC